MSNIIRIIRTNTKESITIAAQTVESMDIELTVKIPILSEIVKPNVIGLAITDDDKVLLILENPDSMYPKNHAKLSNNEVEETE